MKSVWLNGTSNSLSHLDLRLSGLKSQMTITKCPLDVPDACLGCNPRTVFAGSANFQFTSTGLIRQTRVREFTKVRHYVSFVTDTSH